MGYFETATKAIAENEQLRKKLDQVELAEAKARMEIEEIKDLAKFHYDEGVEFFGALEDILVKANESKESFIEESVLDEIINIAEKALAGDSNA